jgi:hypothetical protein
MSLLLAGVFSTIFYLTLTTSLEKITNAHKSPFWLVGLILGGILTFFVGMLGHAIYRIAKRFSKKLP